MDGFNPLLCRCAPAIATDYALRNLLRTAFVQKPQLVTSFAGDNFPAHIFPSIIGRPILRAEEKIQDIELKDIMVGDEVTKARDLLETSYPITNGIVQKWDDMNVPIHSMQN